MMRRRSISSVHKRGRFRVLMLLENSAYSADGRVRCEANSLAAAGYQVMVIGPRGPKERWRERFGQVEVYQFPPPPEVNSFVGYFFEYGYTLAVISFLTIWLAFRRGFDVIHAHNPPDFFVLIGGFWRLFGKRFIFDHHDLAPEMYLARFSKPGNGIVHRLLVFFERLSCRWADQVIVTNNSYKKIDMQRNGVPASRITVVRNGPEPWHLRQFENEPTQSTSDRQLVIGYVGIMGYQDGVDYLLRALHVLSYEFNCVNWSCVLIGTGDAFHDLVQLANELGIAARLRFVGWVDYEKVPEFIGRTDICVAPDPANTYNNRSTIVKLMEYMAQAKPVVAFGLPENRVTAGETALYAEPNDERDFARQILRLIDDPTLRRTMGEAGKLRILEHFTWQHQEPQLLDVYCRLLGNRQPGLTTAVDHCEFVTADT
jgi:glycosyltransferase involved in cell wall biosynthesis